jgi:hypothetical protein
LITIKVSAGNRYHTSVEMDARRECEPNLDPHQTMMVPRGKDCRTVSVFPYSAGPPLTGQPKLRFAVGTFDSWSQVRDALRDLRVRGLVLDSFNCVALTHLFSERTILAPDQKPVAVQALPFSGTSAAIACTSGPLADRLMERLAAGASSLRDALGLWLIPRHAAHFDDAVRVGRILLWIRVADADDERLAYQSLLAHSSNSVGVHDLIVPSEQ